MYLVTVQVAERLVEMGADLSLRCKWTHMSALHYAAYFDVAPVLEKLLRRSKGADVDTCCAEFENGTALHIAASNLSAGAATVLVAFGADADIKDDLARRPLDCVPEDDEDFLIPNAAELAQNVRELLSKRNDGAMKKSLTSMAAAGGGGGGGGAAGGGVSAVSGRTVLKALGLQVCNDGS